MLSDLDEFLLHQVPDTFCHAGTSDPRFFDRHWFAFYDDLGRNAIQMTLGVYKNMNVTDAGLIVIDGDRQYNLRTSRGLRPDFAMRSGPLEIEVVQPFTEIVVRAHPNESGRSAELVWRATHLAAEEHPHFVRARGRVVEDYRRYQQPGRCSGWIEIAPGRRVEIDDWWGTHDHSWGIRPGHGVPEPVTSEQDEQGAARRAAAQDQWSLHAWGRVSPDQRFLNEYNFFSTPELAGYVHLNYRGDDQTYVDGALSRTPTSPPLGVQSCRAGFELIPGTQRFRRSWLDLTLEDGQQVQLSMQARGSSVVMPGLGYSGGYRDGLGLGVWRGESLLEYDDWLLRGAEEVVLDDERVSRPRHRLQPVRVEASGDGWHGVGTGSTTLVFNGRPPQGTLLAGKADR